MFEGEPAKRIEGIQFGLLSPEEIKCGSVVHVIHPETMDGGVPKEGGLIDLRMGTTERMFLCQTCNQSSYECTGHYGHIELARPMFHMGYIGRIKKVLECICFYCSKIKISKTRLNRGLNECWDVLKGKNLCEGEPGETGITGCGNKQPIIRREGLNLAVFMKGEDGEGKVLLNGEKVYSMLKKMSEEDYRFLGFDSKYCKPEWMLLTVMLVPPPSMRPSIVMNGFLRGEDDLTHKLADIVKSNAYLRKYEQEGAPGHIVRDYEQLLQFHLATFIDNDIGGQPQSLQKNGRPLKSISARLKGKEGRVRGNLMGKRVDFSARSVITPDPNISCEEVGVPIHVAQVHTFPERVNSFNMEALSKLVQNGPNEYPGANYVVRNDGQRIDLHFNRQDLRLEKGAIVERHMQNNDSVMFNRQPSLHKMSMMGHRARIMEGKTFRLNLSVTAPYNADFDGDEMNLHMPQSYNAMSELSSLTNVSHQIVSPQSNKPVIGIVQDATVGSRLFTLRDTFFNRREAMSLLFSINSLGNASETLLEYMEPTIMQPVELWTGKQIYSALLPSIFYNKASNFSPLRNFKIDNVLYRNDEELNILCNQDLNDSVVLVRNGLLLKGVIDKKFVGAQQGGCIHIIYSDCGSEAAKLFIDNAQKLVNHFLMHISSFSIGIGDCVADPSTLVLCRQSIHGAMANVDEVINKARRSELEKLPGMSIGETFESSVNVILNKARDVSGTSAQSSLNSQNNMKSMVIAGSKGSYINISQMTTCVGQQNVEGKRIPFGFSERSLPHFYKYDYSAKARGFVENSYLSGLSPCEYFFHAMGGREGLIDTAIKTAETGYIQRRLVKALEGAAAHHDYSVRMESGGVLQFVYGDDTFDATHLENVFVDLSNFKEKFFIDNFIDLEYAIQPESVSNDVYELMCDDANLQQLLDKEYEYLYANRGLLSDRYPSPVNIQRILMKYGCRPGDSVRKEEPDTISPYRILESVKSLMTGNALLDYYIRISLNVRTVLLGCPSKNFDSVIEEIKTKIFKARVNANEMVGTLAAQSVGEPATQMTLNTFHLAGVSSSVTMGVPRFNEIINVSRAIRTPSMRVILKEEFAGSPAAAKLIQTQIEYCSMRHVCTRIQVVYDPEARSTGIDSDRKFIEDYFEMPDEDLDYDALGKFIIRLEISRSELVTKNLSLEYIAGKIRHLYGKKCHIITSDENDINLVIRVRFAEGGSSAYYGDETPVPSGNILEDGNLQFYGQAQSQIMNIHLQGYENINRAYITGDGDRWCLQTDGINFKTLLSHPSIEGSKLMSNDFMIINSVLGIEAARQSILNELSFVIGSNGSYVNQRHLGLLSDVMTLKGFITGITRHGVNKAGAGALRRASFEETVDILLEAAVSSEHDTSAGITENIMMGQLAPLGTGSVELILDLKKLDYNYFPSGCHDTGAYNSSVCYSPVSNSSQISWSPQALPGNTSVSGFSLLGFSPDISPLQSPSALSTSSYLSGGLSPLYMPASPAYTPTSPAYVPVSPAYKPTSQSYTPVSPSYSPLTTAYMPASPSYTPASPSYTPASPSYTPASPSYMPASPSYKPTSPSYRPSSPGFSYGNTPYVPKSPSYIPMSVSYTPLSPSYSPSDGSIKSKDEKHRQDSGKSKQ
ncbi:DNA-directed RNA polymerase II subunit RPB1 [Pancytospora epiphaga]|nr:DNA-directed RNA polymerase II subunit RPB1 [Pancytospora epiphaga]